VTILDRTSLPGTDTDRESDERLARLRAEIRELEDEYIDTQLRIAAAQDRLDEIARLAIPAESPGPPIDQGEPAA
jgi:hypothetical protein